jgi:hypothetical protein
MFWHLTKNDVNNFLTKSEDKQYAHIMSKCKRILSKKKKKEEKEEEPITY